MAEILLLFSLPALAIRMHLLEQVFPD